MKKLLIATSCLSGFLTNAQSNNPTNATNALNRNLDFKYALKFSNITTISRYGDASAYDYRFGSEAKNANWVAPAISLLIKNKRNNFHELELSGIGINSIKTTDYDVFAVPNPSIGKTSASYITFQYQYVHNFLKHTNSRWMPSLAIGVTTDYRFTKEENNTNNAEPYKGHSNELTFTGYITPGITYDLSKKFLLSFSVPIALISSYSAFGTSSYQPDYFHSSYQDNVLTGMPNKISFKLSLGLKL
jgi:hypothetical protein